jgi:hypothetical protein
MVRSMPPRLLTYPAISITSRIASQLLYSTGRIFCRRCAVESGNCVACSAPGSRDTRGRCHGDRSATMRPPARVDEDDLPGVKRQEPTGKIAPGETEDPVTRIRGPRGPESSSAQPAAPPTCGANARFSEPNPGSAPRPPARGRGLDWRAPRGDPARAR